MNKNKILLISSLLISLSINVMGQIKSTSSGITTLNLIIDDSLKDLKTVSVDICNPYCDLKPIKINDLKDTLQGVFYTFGPTLVQLKIEDQANFLLCYPHENISIKVSKVNQKIALDYRETGSKRDILNDNQLIPKYTYQLWNHQNPTFKAFEIANDFRNDRLNTFHDAVATFETNIQLSVPSKRLVENNIYLATLQGIINYDSSMQINNSNVEQDSTALILLSIPKRDLSYYNRIITPTLLDTAILFSATYHSFMESLVNDSLLNLPNIYTSSPEKFFENAKDKLHPYIGNNRNLFYDMLVSTAYILQLEKMTPFSNAQKEDINIFFSNNTGIRDYLFEENRLITIKPTSSNVNYLLENVDGNKILNDILTANKGKIIVLDFWATWCGPCIQAFPKFNQIKEKHKDDLVFIYLTDISSSIKNWYDYTEILSGSHYYLSEVQSNYFRDKYIFDAIPTYVVFDADGSNLGTKTGNLSIEQLEEWIIKDSKK